MAHDLSQMNSARLQFHLEESLSNLPPPRTFPYIFRVPKELKNGNEHHYSPSTICIGPLHAFNPNLDLVDENLKTWTLREFVTYLPRDKTLKDLIDVLEALEENVRACYMEDIVISSEEFVKLLLLDGCFILGLILSGPVFSGMARARGPLLYNLKQDLLLVENQIPFFVLKALWEVAYPPNNPHNNTLVQHALSFFEEIWPGAMSQNLVMPPMEFNLIMASHLDLVLPEPRHLLELFLHTLFPLRPKSSIPPNCTLRNKTKLARHGVKLQPSFVTSLADVRFTEGGVHTIPALLLHKSTASLFKNLLAFEQWCGGSGEESSCFTSYLILLDTLIDTEEDVDRLVEAGVLITLSNDKQALISLLSSLAANVATAENFEHFQDVYVDLSNHCDSRRARWRAYVMRHYYESRWDIMNNILLFILTFAQTLFTILSYNPRK